MASPIDSARGSRARQFVTLVAFTIAASLVACW